METTSRKPLLSMKIGDFLIREGLLTQRQLQEALLIQQRQKKYEPLGQICIRQKFFSRQQLQAFLRKYKKSISLGYLLINLGMVTEKQLDAALEKHKLTGQKLGQVLVGEGIISEVSLINALSLQLGIPKIQPDPKTIDRKLLTNIKVEFLRKRCVLPAYRNNDLVVAIMADPLDNGTLADLANIFKCEIDPAIASHRDITNTINLLYGFEGEDPASRVERRDLTIDMEGVDADEAGREVVEIVNFIVSQAIVEKASDIHIEPMEDRLRIRYRVDGVMQHKTDFPKFLSLAIASRIKAVCHLDTVERRRPQDGRLRTRFMDRDLDLRISTYIGIHGENIVIRILDQTAARLEMDELGLNPVILKRFTEILDIPTGIVLVTGPTGCGKSTTLYACLNYLNNMSRTIITVEDPVEYSIDGLIQSNYTPKLGIGYNDYIKSMMRQDPDIIMVGEIRDLVAAEAVIQCALTGHKVLTTFHTEDSCGALLRLMDMGVNTFLISSTVVSVIAQRLVRRLCKYCKEPYKPSRQMISAFNINPEGAEKFTFYKPAGCAHCNYSGFYGRTGIHEHLILNEPIRDAILARQTSSQIKQVARDLTNLVSLHEEGFYKAARGVTSLEEILRVAYLSPNLDATHRTVAELVDLCEDTSKVQSPF